jgi:hypothetical protein
MRRADPAKRMGDLNELRLAGVCLSLRAARDEASMVMCAEDDVSPDARYCDKAQPGR